MSSNFDSPMPLPQLERSEMSMLQAFLFQMGYNPGPNDGLWSKKTKAAWTKFAVDNALDVDTIDLTVWDYIANEENRPEDLVPGPGGDEIFTTYGPDGGTGETVGAAGSFVAGDGRLDEAELIKLRELFPSIDFLLDDPEIIAILEQAIQGEGWELDKLELAIEGTEWFETTEESRRLFDMSIERDPATVEREIQQQIIIMENMMGVYGIDINETELRGMAFDILRDGNSDAEVLRKIGNLARAQGQAGTGTIAEGTGGLKGELAGMVAQLQQDARRYHLGYSDAQLEEWAVRIIEGRWSFEGAKATMRSQASIAYPGMADQIEQGMTVEDFFAPTKNRLAQLLDMNPNAIDLTSEKWSEVTQMVDEGGIARPMTFTELGRYARNQDEWWTTDAANEQGYGVLNGLLKTFGAI